MQINCGMANNVDETEIYVLGGRSGEISVLFSRNFVEAHSNLQGSTSKNITNFIVQEPITVAAITHVTPANNVSTTDLPVSKWQSSAAIATMVTGEQSLDAASALRLVHIM
ncbi:uncharacterized protein LOC107628475 [Arachis ipaensis]|uniref:uncharacterized protein LOC107628475 n=1 Tax=Arachis ipaensis TaxID=130454 RepID=UPI000A2AEFB9|nr:uncharacterized protein LOC107628475 [Arachis ipaensis]